MPADRRGYGVAMSPTTGPRPGDIAFDHAAAAVAVGALDRAAAVLADVALARSDAAAAARADFAGAYADDFTRSDRDLAEASGDARSAVAALRAAIVGAAAAARQAQAARSVEQIAWDDAHAHPTPVGVA